MSSHLDQIVRKRRLLMALAAEQRAELAVQAIALKQSLAYADLAWRAYRKIKSSPVAAAGLAAALVALGPGKLLRIGYRSGLLIVGLLRLIRIVRALR
jgi:YqjK-like protein